MLRRRRFPGFDLSFDDVVTVETFRRFDVLVFPAGGLPLELFLSFELGFGDIVPLAPGPRFLSVLEAITGQLYIATSIARIIGLYLKR